MTKNTKSANDGLAMRMASLSKRSAKELGAMYEKQFWRSPSGFSRNALIRALAATPVKAETKATAPKETPTKPEKPTTGRKTGAHDPRLPKPGTVLEREYKGKTHKVTVREDGFEYGQKTYRSLTAVAKVVSGYPSISGTLFWGIAKPATPKTKG